LPSKILTKNKFVNLGATGYNNFKNFKSIASEKDLFINKNYIKSKEVKINPID